MEERSIFPSSPSFARRRPTRSIAHSPLLSSRSLTRPRASRPPSSKAYDYRIVDHTVICHAAAVALPSSVLARRCAGAGAKATDEQTPRQKKIVWAVGERGRTDDGHHPSREGLTRRGRVEWSNYRHKFLTGSSGGRFELHVITRPNRTRLTWNTTRRSWDAAASL